MTASAEEKKGNKTVYLLESYRERTKKTANLIVLAYSIASSNHLSVE
jgi:hypothetical protein